MQLSLVCAVMRFDRVVPLGKMLQGMCDIRVGAGFLNVAAGMINKGMHFGKGQALMKLGAQLDSWSDVTLFVRDDCSDGCLLKGMQDAFIFGGMLVKGSPMDASSR